jgi:hypothetical protein
MRSILAALSISGRNIKDWRVVMRDFLELVMGNKKEALHTGATFILTLLLISLMGWSLLDWPVPSKTPTLVDKSMLRLHTSAAMAEHTAAINSRMELQALQVSK